VNARLGRCVVDFLWRGRRLSVETDGYGARATRLAFERGMLG
jgi:very-short-patch-repair endonuclease